MLTPYYELLPGAIAPQRAHAGDAGMDLALQEDRVLQPGETAYIPSGVRFILPYGVCAHVMTRSSTFKRGVVVIPTIVDASYTGQASVIVTNTSNDVVKLLRGDKIAQVVLISYLTFTNEIINNNCQDRHDGKFGSTGERL